MGLPKSFKDMNKDSRGSLTQGKVLENYISDPTTNLAGFGNRSSSYSDFIKKLAVTDRGSAKRLLNDTAVEIWKGQQKNGEYEGPRTLAFAVAADIRGLPKKQEDLEKHLNHLRETDFKKYMTTLDEISYISDMTEEAMYGPGGFLLAGGPAPKQEMGLFSEKAFQRPDFKERVKKYLLDLEPTVVFEERRFRKPKPVLDEFDYENLIEKQLRRSGKGSIKTLYTACKELEKEVQEEKRRGIKLIREEAQKRENYHPVRNKLIYGGLITIAGMAFAAGVYGATRNNQPSETPDEEGEYARSAGLSDDLINRIKNADDNSVLGTDEKTMIDFLANIDAQHQQQVVDAVYKDNILSHEEARNMIFLGNLSEDVRNPIIEGGDAANCNFDGDNFDNVDDQELGMPWDVYNPRLVLLVETTDDPTMIEKINSMYSFLTEEQKIPEGNVKKLVYTDATKENIEKAISEISQKADKNSLFFCGISSHGGEGYIVLNDGNGDFKHGPVMSYTNLDKLVDKVISPTVISVSACDKETALEPLKDGPAPRVVMTMPADWIFATSKKYPNIDIESMPTQYDYVAPEDYDTNRDGFVSFRESYETMMASMKRFLSTHPEITNTYGIVDTDSISDKTFLGGYSVFD